MLGDEHRWMDIVKETTEETMDERCESRHIERKVLVRWRQTEERGRRKNALPTSNKIEMGTGDDDDDNGFVGLLGINRKRGDFKKFLLFISNIIQRSTVDVMLNQWDTLWIHDIALNNPLQIHTSCIGIYFWISILRSRETTSVQFYHQNYLFKSMSSV